MIIKGHCDFQYLIDSYDKGSLYKYILRIMMLNIKT